MRLFHDKDNEIVNHLIMNFKLHLWRYCLNALSCPQNVLTLLYERIVHFVYGKCNPFVVDGVLCVTLQNGIPKSTNLRNRFKIETSGLIQKWCVHALKPHNGLNYNDIYLWLVIWEGWTRCNAHSSAIVCCNYYSFCYMMMSE